MLVQKIAQALSFLVARPIHSLNFGDSGIIPPHLTTHGITIRALRNICQNLKFTFQILLEKVFSISQGIALPVP